MIVVKSIANENIYQIEKYSVSLTKVSYIHMEMSIEAEVDMFFLLPISI